MDIEQRKKLAMRMSFVAGFPVGLLFAYEGKGCFIFYFGIAIALLSMSGFIVNLWEERKR